MNTREFILCNVYRTARSLAVSGEGSHRRDSGGSKLNDRHERAKDGWVSWSRIGTNWLGRPLTQDERAEFTTTLDRMEHRGLLIRERAMENEGRTTWVKLTEAGNRIAAELVAVTDDIERKASAVATARRAFQHFSDDLQQHETKIDKLEKQLTSLEAERPSMYPADFERERSAIAYHLEHTRFLANCSRSMAKQWQQTLADAEAADGGG